jgi:hypothetical protein
MPQSNLSCKYSDPQTANGRRDPELALNVLGSDQIKLQTSTGRRDLNGRDITLTFPR